MFLKVYKYANILSIDVVAGACISTLCIADLLGVPLTAPIFICLSAAVFVIYTADHLMDAHRVKHAAHTARHLFHQQHFALLSVCIVLLTLLGLIFMFWLPYQTILYGGVLAVIVSLYFLSLKIGRHHWLYHKELLVAFIYVAGVFLGPVSMAIDLPQGFSALFLQFFLLALINVLVFSCYEKEADEKDGHISFVQNAGLAMSKKIIWALIVAAGISLLAVPIFFPDKLLALQPVIAAMLITLIIITAFPSHFKHHDKYRLWGDAIFLYPIFYFVF